uniref:Reverse transcriptase zinc-binding domain-containing protein n=1 Tax=Arundo donax TaxID=35708 RepID=A0A0A9BWZ5_ARUDO
MWLIFKDSLNSRSLLRRRNYKLEGDDYSCVLCNLNLEETTYHLFFECPFSTRCWNFVGIQWDHAAAFFDTIQIAKTACQHQFFMGILIITAWEIWKQRNAQIFRGTTASFQSWKQCFIHTVQLHVHRCKPALRDSFLAWLNDHQ